jgi:hypothetical protein
MTDYLGRDDSAIENLRRIRREVDALISVAADRSWSPVMSGDHGPEIAVRLGSVCMRFAECRHALENVLESLYDREDTD